MRATILSAGLAACCLVGDASAANVAKSYSYFSIGGSTLSEIETELSRRGPHVQSTGRRHPGATAMQFTTKLGFAQQDGSCRIVKASVSVRARVTLPSWRRPKKAENATRLIWDTLAADIKRHEESHIGIAKNAARDLEAALRKLGDFRDCGEAAEKARTVSARILSRHDEDQARFDRVEGKNFESRILRLLQYRMQRIRAVAAPG